MFLSFLPASHAYEHSGGQHFPVALGAEIYYAESLEKLAANIEEVHPTIMVVVPRLFEMLRARIMKTIENSGGLSKYLLHRALKIGNDRYNGAVKPWDLPMDGILSLTLRKKVKAKVGGRTKAWVSGGAPLNPEVGNFFQSLGITFLQGYGQTEAGPVISCNRPSAGIRLETVGPPVKNCEVRIAEDGEILVRGENVMHGYWHNPDETARVLKDGWLHTGDVGHFDSKGRIVITDRKKDLIVNDKGDNVSPQRIEGILTIQPEIAQAMIYGDRRPHLVALLVPDPEIASAADLQQRLQKAMDRVNSDLNVIEKIRRFIVADEGVHDRERATDAVNEDPASHHLQGVRRPARRALQALGSARHRVGHEVAEHAAADGDPASGVQHLSDVAAAQAARGTPRHQRIAAAGNAEASAAAHMIDVYTARVVAECDDVLVDDDHVIGPILRQAAGRRTGDLAGGQRSQARLIRRCHHHRSGRRRVGAGADCESDQGNGQIPHCNLLGALQARPNGARQA